VSVSFDESSLVPAAGLSLAAALAQRLDLGRLVEARLTSDRHGFASGRRSADGVLAGSTEGRVDLQEGPDSYQAS